MSTCLHCMSRDVPHKHIFFKVTEEDVVAAAELVLEENPPDSEFAIGKVQHLALCSREDAVHAIHIARERR